MYVIADKSLPEIVKTSLTLEYKVIEFSTEGLTNNYLSGHPDIFFCRLNNKLICAPNTPANYLEIISRISSIEIIIGEKPVGFDYPDCALYNCVCSKNLLIHNFKYSDLSINTLTSYDKINVNQGLTRCSLIPLSDNNYITSDKNIEQTLKIKGYNVLYVNPRGIILPGMEYGLIGGCAGVNEKKVYFTGSLNKFAEGEKIYSFLNNLNYKIVELSDLPLYDGGSIIFI